MPLGRTKSEWNTAPGLCWWCWYVGWKHK